MSGPTLLFGVGATKAGTSWLYTYLHDHPECAMPAVKEAHYWDTFDPVERAKQIDAFEAQRARFEAIRDEAEANQQGWKVRNMTRQIDELAALIDVVGSDRTGDAHYAAWLSGRGERPRLVGDITPSYALLPEARLRRMTALSPASKVIYLMRDPISRLWSHVRMQARRKLPQGRDFATKANNTLWRVINKGAERHLTERGDYAGAVTRLRDAVPAGRLMIVFMEQMLTPEGLARICDFLGLTYKAAKPVPVHEGEAAEIRDDLRPKVAAYLQDQYDWVAANVGPLPDQWRDNLQRAYA